MTSFLAHYWVISMLFINIEFSILHVLEIIIVYLIIIVNLSWSRITTMWTDPKGVENLNWKGTVFIEELIFNGYKTSLALLQT